jgi:D-aminopeptidase
VLVQTNFGGKLTIAGAPIWKELTPGAAGGLVSPKPSASSAEADGSCMIVVATDAPLDARNLERLAARAIFALARTGSTYSNGSGDFAIAFSTHPSLRVVNTNGPQPRTVLPTDAVSGLFEAVLDATEEAVYNSLLKATTTTGSGRTIQALPIDRLREVLKKYGR